MIVRSLTDVYSGIYEAAPDPEVRNVRVVVQEQPELQAVQSYLDGNVPQQGSQVVDWVNKMVF